MTTETFAPVVRQDGTFRVYAPLFAFEKSDAEPGKKRRIGGVITTDTRDRQNEVVLQQGLDFDDFLKSGWFNDNHGKAVDDVLGEPDPSALRFFKKGEKLPNGAMAGANCHWAEGWLYEDDPRADRVWKKALAMQKSPSGRRLGFSIEGAILRRAGTDLKTIAKAKIKNVAITHCPVNVDTSLDVLAKSLAEDVEQEVRELREKQARTALGASAEAAEQVTMDGITDLDEADRPVDGLRAIQNKALSTANGRPLMPQSLEHDAHANGVPRVRKSMTVAEAVDYVRKKYPNISCATAGRVVDLTLALKRRGQGVRDG